MKSTIKQQPITLDQLKVLYRDFILENGTEEELINFNCERDFKELIQEAV